MRVKYDKQTLIDILRIGAEGEFRFPCQQPRLAYRLRQMLYYYRKKLREDNDPLYLTANTVVISIEGNKLIARPYGMKDLKLAVEKHKNKRKEIK